MARGVRGVRASIPAGSVVGRKRGSGTGVAQLLSINDIAQQLATGGSGISIQPGGSASLPTIADGTILANISGAPAAPTGDTLTAILDHVMGSTEGQILQRGASAWQVLAPGTANQVLSSGGAAALNAWAGLSSLLDAVFGNTEGNILQRGASVWQVLAPGTAGNVLTSGGPGALNSWQAPASGGITQLTGDGTAGPGSGSQVLTLSASGVTAGTYTYATITVNAKGLVTAASSNTVTAPKGMLPLVTGETPGPVPIADGNGQYIGVPL